MSEWVVIVPPLPMKEARAALAEWIEARTKAGEIIDPGRIIEDIIRSWDGKGRIRYRLLPSEPDQIPHLHLLPITTQTNNK